MTNWEKRITDAFIDHYFASAPDSSADTPASTGANAGTSIGTNASSFAGANAAVSAGDKRGFLRLRSSVFFPGFDKVHPDERVSYLEAAESLERKGIVKLSWEKRGERLKTISCQNFEELFKEAKRPFPDTEAKSVRDMLKAKAEALRETPLCSPDRSTGAKNVIALIDFYSIHFCPREIGQGIDRQTMEEFIRLLEFMLEPARFEKITTRSLSILLYRDSKRLEKLLALCNPLLSRAQKFLPVPDLSFLERSYPEAMISGKINIEYKNQKTPLINAGGHLLGIPLENAEEIEAIKLISGKEEKTVLTIENKETFFALGSPAMHGASKNLSGYDCFLYIGGYFNRAAAALIKTLAASGFSFYHAGDLDPDGILILQQIKDLAEKPVTPLRMDAATFDQYCAWGRTLTKPMLNQIKKISEETKAIPGIADLLRRIEETGLGVEQEIVDYR